ncbi:MULTISPECIES: HVO_A0556 family zinc finger protein [Halorussus]|uniref:HVO_A0556 family zinc finger protein n=1 Tax=Halorussus TaxID=1070314 RepID=UPI00209DA1D1|nr:HVO_A0556 family zinc finger protein [Halorussus vallis]USZ77415.1 hypothetical protein NGM07_08795 [Halorussus vallis]
MQRTSVQEMSEDLLGVLVGDECRWCATGTLAREEFKSDDAVVCENCGTPAVRVW